MNKYDYNVIVIGGGSAGLVSAYIAAATYAKVALVEQHKMGGDCLNTGCVPSKALLRSAKMLSYAKRAKEFGFNQTTVDFDFAQVMQRVQNVIAAIAPHDSIERYQKLGVDCVQGNAQIIDKHTVVVDDRTITAGSIIVATGAKPVVPNIKGIDAVDYLTSDTVWQLKQLPKKLAVLGGGPIGVELAQAFARFGSQVTIVEMADSILVREDEDVIRHVTQQLMHDGVKILTNHMAIELQPNLIVCKHNDNKIIIECDHVLIALGRQANATGFGLEKLNVQLNNNRTIHADPFLRTNIPNIYVCGDVTGPYQFTHVAGYQAWYAAINALFAPFKKFKVDYSVIPWATFCDPEIARVGLNEKEAQAKNIPYDKTVYGIDDLDRAIADTQANGFIKVLTKPGTDKILGVTSVGAHASDTIAEFVLAMRHRLGLNAILKTIHIYPTLSEANKYVAGNWRRAHLPKWLKPVLLKYHEWRRA